GIVKEVRVKEGDQVKKGQTLAVLDDRDLRLQLENAQVSLQSAQARLKQLEEGNATPQDLASAEASLRNAQANLTKTVTGNVTKSDIDSAKASVANAEAQLRKAINGSATPADIASAQSQVNSAQAKLDELLAGPTAAQVSSAQAKVDQARSSLDQTRSSASASKTQAEADVNTAANGVRDAQESLSDVYWDTHNEDGSWKKGADDFGYQDDVDRYNAAVRAEQDAQGKLAQAKVSLENARIQESADIAAAESQLRDAEAQLRDTQQGATPSEIASARSTLTQAQANLDNLRSGGTKVDVDAARANLAQAQANLNKLYEGGTKADVAASQANVDQAKASLDKLTAPSTATDKEIQQASVAQAEQSVKQAELKLEYATLYAPFDGVVTSVGVVPGASAGGTTIAMQLVDRSTLYVELKLSENDVARVATGLPVELTIDALEGWTATGEISYISPVAEDSNGVVTYDVKVAFPDSDPRVRIGMTANLSIVTASKENVLLVPSTALLPKGAGRVVQVPDGAGVREVDVTVGLSDGASTEILSGLDEGQEIVSVPASDEQGGGLFGR
ncbi:MAG TPA: efflux RND transporter periplasmic adaptor subunit, partial [Herpetosiphonaceae bacterium]